MLSKRGFVVVANNSHQLPLGTIKFQTAYSRWYVAKRKQEQLSMEEDIRVKSQVIQYLINGQLDVASELYQNKERFLTKSSKIEIVWYVLRTCDDKDLVEYLFPNLQDESADTNDTNVDDTMQEDESKVNWKLAFARKLAFAQQQKAHGTTGLTDAVTLSQQDDYGQILKHPRNTDTVANATVSRQDAAVLSDQSTESCHDDPDEAEPTVP